MIALGVDTGSRTTSLALVQDGALRAAFSRTDAHPPRDEVFLHVRALLAEAGLGLPDLDAFACCIGPGSFTGLRIGVTMVKTFGWALDRPVFGLDAVALTARRALADAHGPRGDGPFHVATRGSRDTLYWGTFRAGPGGAGPALDGLAHDEAQDGDTSFLPAGPDLYVSREDLEAGPLAGAVAIAGEPLAAFAARHALDELAAGRLPRPADVQPLYLKPFGVGPRPWKPEDLR